MKCISSAVYVKHFYKPILILLVILNNIVNFFISLFTYDIISVYTASLVVY